MEMVEGGLTLNVNNGLDFNLSKKHIKKAHEYMSEMVSHHRSQINSRETDFAKFKKHLYFGIYQYVIQTHIYLEICAYFAIFGAYRLPLSGYPVDEL